jgi:hypothetical protein
MELRRKQARRLFKELGYHTAKLWDDDRLTRQLNRLPSILSTTPDIPKEIESDETHLCNVICKAITEDNEVISLRKPEGEEMAKTKKKKKKSMRGRIQTIAEYEGREETPKKKKGKKSKKVKGDVGKKKSLKDKKTKTKKTSETKKTKKTSTSKAKVNKFGYRIGSQSAAVDAVLSKKPRDVKEIHRLTKVSHNTIRQHLKHAIENERGVEMTDKGYRSII